MKDSPYTEFVIKVVPSRIGRGAVSSSAFSANTTDLTRSYDALVYGEAPLPGAVPPSSPPPGEQPMLANLPLISVEHLVVAWNQYQEYLAAFLEGGKNPTRMRSLLLRVMSAGLESIFNGNIASNRPIRVWWGSETPELEDLPWELVAYTGRSSPSWFSFVRGVPPETPVPLLPVGTQLRLGFIHDPASTPYGLQTALSNLPPSIQVVQMTGSPREELKRACKEGFELLHIVADGVVTYAYEGVLYTHDPSFPHLAPSELSATLRGTRVTVLSLSAPQTVSPDTVMIAGEAVPSAFRAFALLGNSGFSLPSLVVPLGPLPDSELQGFWQGFYTGLSDTLEVEEAMGRGRNAVGPLAIALFMRQRHGRSFRRASSVQLSPDNDPTQVEAELQRSRALVDQLNTIGSQFGSLPGGVADFLQRESMRQQKLSSDLTPWVELEEGER